MPKIILVAIKCQWEFYAVLKIRFRKQMHRVRLNVANNLINGNDVKTFFTDFD